MTIKTLLETAAAEYKAERYPECVRLFEQYFTRRDRGESEPTVFLEGNTWPGDHVATSYKRAARLIVEGQKYTRWD